MGMENYMIRRFVQRPENRRAPFLNIFTHKEYLESGVVTLLLSGSNAKKMPHKVAKENSTRILRYHHHDRRGHHDLEVARRADIPQTYSRHRVYGEIQGSAVLVQHVVSLKSVALITQLARRRVVRPIFNFPAATRLGLGTDAVGRPIRFVRAYSCQ